MSLRIVAAALALVVLATSCRDLPDSRPPGAGTGDVDAGAEAIEAYGCGSCHTIPGIPDADALVGPPLTSWGHRSFVAGTLPNNFDNLVTWIRDPDEVRPGTAMPDLDVTEADARDVAAYLLSLR